MVQIFKEGAIPEVIKEGLKMMFGPKKILPRNFFYEYEVVRIPFCSNLLLSPYYLLLNKKDQQRTAADGSSQLSDRQAAALQHSCERLEE